MAAARGEGGPGVGVGSVLQGWKLIKVLGKPSGQATVYLAERGSKQGAMKVFKDAEAFHAERDAFFKIQLMDPKHPCLCGCLDIDTEHEALVFELVQGGNLADLAARLSRGVGAADAVKSKLPAVRAVYGAACALAHCAAHGLHHRDVKPDNIMVPAGAEVMNGVPCRVIDFGLAKSTAGLERDLDGTLMAAATTQGGAGTLSFMAPELFLAAASDSHIAVDREKVDVLALGCTLFCAYLKRANPLTDDWDEKMAGIVRRMERATSKRTFSQELYDNWEDSRASFPRGAGPNRVGAFPAALQQLIADSWQREACKRPTLSELCERLKAYLDGEGVHVPGLEESGDPAAWSVHADMPRPLSGAGPPTAFGPFCDTSTKAFMNACTVGDIHEVRKLLAASGPRAVDVHTGNGDGPEAAFRAACRNGHTDIVRQLLGLTGAREVDVHAADVAGPEAAFRRACTYGHTDIVRELLGLTGAREVDVHAADVAGPEAAFRYSCSNGHTDIVCELLGLSGAREVDVHAADSLGPEAAFRWACRGEHRHVVGELLCLTGHRRIPDGTRRQAAKFASLTDLI